MASTVSSYDGSIVSTPQQLVRPESVEFWQGRPSRLHDRLRYERVAGGWRIERLAP